MNEEKGIKNFKVSLVKYFDKGSLSKINLGIKCNHITYEVRQLFFLSYLFIRGL